MSQSALNYYCVKNYSSYNSTKEKRAVNLSAYSSFSQNYLTSSLTLAFLPTRSLK